MTFVQLEYVVAVDNFRHFARAAKECFVTQPTLSMQIHKLERELGTKIFDRNKQPVLPTESGIEIIRHARQILSQRDTMDDVIQSKKGIVSGELKLGIIPTLAPYLLPLFVQSFIRQYPQVKLIVHELTTDNILGRLKDGRIDAGLLVTPLQGLNFSAMSENKPNFFCDFLQWVESWDQQIQKEIHAVSLLSSTRKMGTGTS